MPRLSRLLRAILASGLLPLLLIAFALAGFVTYSDAATPVQQPSPVRLGVMKGPETEVAEVVKTVAAGKGLTVELVTYTDYSQPNAALARGEIDANAFQHRPFLEAEMAAKGYDLVSVGYTMVQPMGIYSRTYKQLRDLPDGARIAIPEDLSNGGRALRLLAERAMIGLAPGAKLTPTPKDVMINTRKFQFVQLPADQVAGAIDLVDAAAINGNYARAAGLDPRRDTIAVENRRSNPYGNILVVRRADQDRLEIHTLLEAFQSPEVAAFLNKRFEGAFLPAW
ncbi:MetQ/NlpA family ABC transporter substrate-binding protein [Tistrella mobilis]|uniref:MetQ/NlpA family ABC transporter substrate-binding protein n=1 Tax=Tistrella mobilis TaxID=171437 RepID=UPI00355820A1